MPIKFLNTIVKRNLIATPKRGVLEGVYGMCCKGLLNKELLYNDGNPTIVLMPKSEDRVKISMGKEELVFDNAWVTYGDLKNVYMHIPCSLEYVIVMRLKKNYFFELFNIDPSFFVKRPICNLEELNNKPLVQEIMESYRLSTQNDRISYLKDVFGAYDYKDTSTNLFDAIVNKIKVSNGAYTVGDLSNLYTTFIHEKWIQRKFKQLYGISPKQYLRMQRFISLHEKLLENKAVNPLDMALSFGFYDRSHLNKEFKAITGMTASSYYARQVMG